MGAGRMDDHDEALKRIRDLKRRIKELRNALYPPQRNTSREDGPTKEVRRSVEQVQETKDKNSELDALRKKLMGKK